MPLRSPCGAKTYAAAIDSYHHITTPPLRSGFAFLPLPTRGTLGETREGQEGSAMSSVPKRLIAISYDNYARDYLRKLPLEHFMESTDQATQRAITLASLALVAAARKDFHVFNEL